MNTDEPTEPHRTDAPPGTPQAADPAELRLFTWGLAVVGLLSLAIVLGSLWWRGRSETRGRVVEPRGRQLVDFRLVERSGRTVERRDLEGRTLVVNFVFTGCSVSCFEISRRMAEVQKRLGGRPDVMLVSVTVDPRSDTPEVLSRFAKRLEADAERWLFLTGDREEVYRLIETSFLKRAPADAMPPGVLAEGMPGDFEHAERIALVDREGRIRCYFDGMKSHVADEILEAVEEFAGRRNDR